MRALFVKHDHASPGGLVEEAFTGLGYEVAEFTVVPEHRYHRPDVTASFPDPAGYDAIVAFGAAWSVYDDDAIGTWIHDEIAFTRQAIGLGVPVLGICFGGQLLAAALGGRVRRAPAPVFGWHPVGTRVPGLIDAGPWFRWHRDRFTVPPGATLLATSPLANQAFTAGRSLGVQFHPELTPAVLRCWLDNGGDGELARAGVDTGELMERTRLLARGAAVRTRKLARGFLSDVAAGPAVPLPMMAGR